MFNDNYQCEAKGIPLVSYYKEIKNADTAYVFTSMHYHSDFEILYIIKGKAKMIVNGNSFYAEAGDMILINPYEVHYGEIASEELFYYCLDFDAKLLGLSFEDKLFSEEIKYKNLLQEHSFEEHIRLICEAYENTPAGWQLTAKGNLFLLFSRLEGFLLSTGPTKETMFSKQVINYVRDNYMKNISSQDVAAAFSYNHSYFCRVFKKHFSQTFSDYLNVYRIKKAKEFLKTENVSSTAMRCGFSGISYFSHSFKMLCGLTPMEYKKSLQERVR